eukprot:jgi/Psemu1/183298/e_gw1.30.169.1
MATCDGCGASFPSRNAVFKHLKETDGACLSKDDYKNFVRYVRKSVKPPKVVLLYGYVPHATAVNGNANGCNKDVIRNGDDAGNILLQTIQKLQNEIDGLDDDDDNNNNNSNNNNEAEGSNSSSSSSKINRSYGYNSRSAECVKQDTDTGAVTEVMTARLYPLRADMRMDDWLDRVQNKLDERFGTNRQDGDDGGDDDAMMVAENRSEVTPIRILGRQDMPNNKFNAEMDITFRRIEYVLPMDFFTWSAKNAKIEEKIQGIPIFKENHKHDIDHETKKAANLDDATKSFMLELKNYFKLLTTRVVELDVTDKVSVMEKEFSAKKLKKKKKKNTDGERDGTANVSDNPQDVTKAKSSQKEKKTNVLKRRRYHNFTEKLMAHDYLTYRRVDRIYHRATMKFPTGNGEELDSAGKKTTYMVLSMSGDLFLTGQACRLVGVIVALANGMIDPEFIDCAFDEHYPHLIPTPPAPQHGMVSSEVHYANQEGKTKRILSPRVSNRYTEGWNNEATIRRVKDWQQQVYKYVDSKWKNGGRDENGRLKSEQDWTENVLLPWAEKANRHLQEYKLWKKNQDQPQTTKTKTTTTGLPEPSATTVSRDEKSAVPESTPLPQSECIDPAVPEMYGDVLHHLRKLDASGEWPSTSSKRQLVMVSTTDGIDETANVPGSLAIASAKAKRNEHTNSSAYSYVEGQGGASGSFSVGLMPGGVYKQPKANSMFPELVKAAFELERKLFPEREPSSTIAINRNAQFRPHTDSGAGAGQSTSLIVGLGAYSGGELMVEGDKHDIRYKAIEFDGWKQRHWTLPFKGERYSLVWFTPKGCEGMRGIDLEL